MHEVKIREELRVGICRPEYRIICSCGWEEKAPTHADAKKRSEQHAKAYHPVFGNRRN